MYYVYVLESLSKPDELYVGSTIDLKGRFRLHNQGKVFSTKRYKPWKLIYYEAYETEDLARAREQKLKHHGNAIKELKKRMGKNNNFKNNKSGAGFTLIELLVVISIIGLLASAVIAALDISRRNGRDTQYKENLKTLEGGIRLFGADNGGYPTTTNSIGLDTCYNPTDCSALPSLSSLLAGKYFNSTTVPAPPNGNPYGMSYIRRISTLNSSNQIANTCTYIGKICGFTQGYTSASCIAANGHIPDNATAQAAILFRLEGGQSSSYQQAGGVFAGAYNAICFY